MLGKPFVGAQVIYREGDFELGNKGHAGTNGTTEHPAMVTRVWSDTCVNLTVFWDAQPPSARTSVVLRPELPPEVKDTSGASCWFWPEEKSPAVPENPASVDQAHVERLAADVEDIKVKVERLWRGDPIPVAEVNGDEPGQQADAAIRGATDQGKS